ncbi:MAG: glycosyltransferase family protein [Rhizobiaceae bacterium]
MKRLDHVRILMYSHDTFGLGHLRRCRAIAHSIVDRFKGVNVIIISGSQIAGAFDFRARVDFVKIPSVIKLYNGEYNSIGEYIELDDILRMRKLIIQRTAESFEPDILIVDKEPLGLQGELEPTLKMLGRSPAKTILGLRDVMDSPENLEREWAPKSIMEKINRYYDRIWVYGPDRFWDPLGSLDLPGGLQHRLKYVGWLDRELPSVQQTDMHFLPEEYILVTAGGGGDGSALMEQVLAAREHDWHNDYPIVMVLGPFMKSENRERIRLRASSLSNVTIIDFEARLEWLLSNAVGVVGMCGYNTFCEVLSFNRKALFVPRTQPRQEQYIRASRGRELGLCEMLTSEEASIPSVMANALRQLPNNTSPSKYLLHRDLAGLDEICSDIEELLSNDQIPAVRCIREKQHVSTIGV